MKRPIILLYHSVVPVMPEYDNFLLRVSATNFRGHVQYLKREHTIVSLKTFVSLLESERLPYNAVAITFDDGYADNLSIAAPILTEEQAAASFFLCSGLLGREFWWDRLERLIYTTNRLPQEFTLKAGQDVRVTVEQRHNRIEIFMTLWSIFRVFEPLAREDALNRLADDLRLTRTSNQLSSLTPDDVRKLSGDLFEIGAHTINHRSLRGLSFKELTREVIESKSDCETLGLCSVSSFSYPHGDFDAAAQEVVIAAGFQRACAVGDTHVRGSDSSFALPRMHVRNWTPTEFAHQLAAID